MRIYVGARHESQVSVVVRDHCLYRGERLLPSSHYIHNHSPDGYEWGYCGSGPAQLALSLLLDATGRRGTAVRLYQDFKREIVACLAHDQWALGQDEILAWVAAHPSTVIV